jgi:hypothetical protein
MAGSLGKYIFNLVLMTLVLMAAGYGVFLFLLPGWYFAFFPAVPLFLFAVTLLMHFYLLRAGEKDARKFTSKYLGAMGVKIFIYIIFLVIILFLATEHAVPFLVSFLACYAAFTFLEVMALIRLQKRTGS